MVSVKIVGGGIGGLCTGLLLASKGYDVCIYEKNPQVGGVIQRLYSPDGRFSFEQSASIAINPHTFQDFLDLVDSHTKLPLQTYPLSTLYNVYFKDQPPLSIPRSSTDQPQDYQAFITKVEKNYTLAKRHLLNHPYLSINDFLNLRVLRALIKILPITDAAFFIKHHVKNKSLQEILLFQTFFMGSAPSKLPNIYTAIAAHSQVEGISHIEGGLSAYTQKLATLFEQKGGKLYCNTPVKRIVHDGKKIKGILIDNTFSPADIVVVNADYLYAQKCLLNRSLKRSYTLSCSTFIIHLGLSKKYPQLHLHNLLINEDFEQGINHIFKGILPQKPSLYVYSPSCIDDSYCQHNEDSVLNIMVRVPHLASLNIPWSHTTQEALYKLCLATLVELTHLDDLPKHIVYHHMTHPRSFAHTYHYYAGSCFGLAHTFRQSMVFRPQVKDKMCNHLYYVGSSIHPGNGASIVIDCAKLAAQAICQAHPLP